MIGLQLTRLLSIFGTLLVGIWLPLRWIGYTPNIATEIFLDLTISAVAALNLYLHFKVSGASPHQLRSWLAPGLILDLMSLMPFSLILLGSTAPEAQVILLFNLAIIRHIRQIKPFLDGFPALQPITYRLIPLLVALPILIHVLACGWIWLGSGSIGPDLDPWVTYVRGVYWTFTTLTTVGYGDIVAKSIPQMLFACGVQVTGACVFGYILSNVAGLLARSDAAREHHMDSLDRIETFMGLHHTPPELRTKIRTYYNYMWTKKKGYRDDTLLDGLPSKIRAELFTHINLPMLKKVPFLKNASPDLIDDLMMELKSRIFIPGERIFRAGDLGDALYFIESGSVAIVSPTDQHIVSLSEGNIFGEIALISNLPRQATTVAETYCDLYSLSREAFNRVADGYPDFHAEISRVMEERQST